MNQPVIISSILNNVCKIFYVRAENTCIYLRQYNFQMGLTFRINLLTPNVKYSGRTAPLTSKVAFYIFIQQI